MKSTAPKLPAVGSLWKFRSLEEPVLFEVVIATERQIFYRTAGNKEEDASSRPLADFLENFVPNA
jgi:hypothetical protein